MSRVSMQCSEPVAPEMIGAQAAKNIGNAARKETEGPLRLKLEATLACACDAVGPVLFWSIPASRSVPEPGQPGLLD